MPRGSGVSHTIFWEQLKICWMYRLRSTIQLFFEYFERLGDLQCLACTQLSYRRPLFTFCPELCLKLKNVAIPGTRIWNQTLKASQGDEAMFLSSQSVGQLNMSWAANKLQIGQCVRQTIHIVCRKCVVETTFRTNRRSAAAYRHGALPQANNLLYLSIKVEISWWLNFEHFQGVAC